MATKKDTPLKPLVSVETLKHDDATRKNIPTAEYQSVMAKDEQRPVTEHADIDETWYQDA